MIPLKNSIKKSASSVPCIDLCNKINANVIGGASKLLKHFIGTYQPKEIISYADRRWSTGNLYDKLGFSSDHNSNPNYFYIINNSREHRFKYRKDILIREGFDKNKFQLINSNLNIKDNEKLILSKI